jgi:predicted AlkP superfamily phosphohydrolase/phosphomutase
MTGRCLLLGLDGATFSLLDPLMRDGVMPFLARFVASGVRGELQSVIPPLTPPAWASITTGRSPGHHGVFDFFAFESDDSRHVRMTNSSDVRCETLWSIVGRHGLRATVLNFPLTAPPRPISGCLVPGWVLWRFLRRACFPRDLYDRLKGLPGFNPRELAMNLELEQKALGGCPPEEQEEWVRVHHRRERQWFEILTYLMRTEGHELAAVVFDGVDKLQHLFWHLLDPAGRSGPDTGVRQLCLEYFRQLDGLIEDTVALAGEDANVFLVSDHGFGPSREIVYMNSWLAQQGLLKWAEVSSPEDSDTFGLGLVGWMDKLVDWSATTAYARTPSSNGIHICVAGRRGPAGIAPDDYLAFRQRLREALLAFRDPKTGEAVITQVWTREEAFPGPLGQDAPDLTVRLRDQGFISTVRSDAALVTRPEPVGVHRPEGIFIGRGPAVAQGRQLAPLSALDITPIALHALGVPVPEDLEGRVPMEVFRREWWQAHPVMTGAPTEPPQIFPGPAPDSQGEEQVLARLKALGYLE